MQAYQYNAALFCGECGTQQIQNLTEDRPELLSRPVDKEDSNEWPQGPYDDGGGESDTPQHCDDCDVFLENPLTDDGNEYVREAYAEARDKVSRDGVPDKGQWSIGVTQIWANHYDYLGLPGAGKCCICLNEIIPLIGSTWTEGHNAEPIAAGRCCNVCNELEVLPQRIRDRCRDLPRVVCDNRVTISPE